MGVGIYLAGRCAKAGARSSNWLTRVSNWLDEHAGEPLESTREGQDHEERPAVFAQLHPCAEELEIIVLEPGRVLVSAKTSTVGPGYHIFVCDLIKRLGTELGITWDPPDQEGSGDETGYFHTGDRAAVETEMLGWLKSMAGIVRENLETEYPWLMVSMPMGHHYRHHGPMVTPLGPRDREWLDRVIKDPRQGIDIFPWWAEGIGAEFHLGRALHRLWTDIRWRTPLNDEEGDLVMNTHLDLCRAYALNPTLSYPWAEWSELLDHIEEYFGYFEWQGGDLEPEIRRQAGACLGPTIGYRRKPVRVDLTAGWSIEIPGSMAEEWDEEGTWSAWDGERTIWFTSFSFTKEGGEKPSAAEALVSADMPEGESIELHPDGPLGRAVFLPYEEEGEPMWQLAARCAVEGGLGVCNIFLTKAGDRDWAMKVCESLEHPD